MKLIARVGTLVFSCLCLVNCWLPEKFDASLDIDKSRQFKFTYDGTIVLSSALDALQDGKKINAEDEQEFKKQAAKFQSAKGVTKAEYVGNARIRIAFHEEGQLLPGSKFFMDFAGFEQNPTGGIRIAGPELDAKAQQALASGGLKLDGNIRMTSALIVTEHNASATPWFGGLWGAYQWHVDSKTKTMPTAVLK